MSNTPATWGRHLLKFSANTAKSPVFGAAAGAFGQDCALCLAPAGPGLVCSACERSLLPASPGAATAIEVVARFEYRFPVDRLLHRFKFGGDLAIGRWLGLQLARELTDCPRPHRLVVPPLANPRLKERGFNQALELAKVLGHRLGIPVERAALSRSAAAPPQTGLGRSERLRNLAGAFSCRRDFSGQDVAIVDDVTTTGATGEAIAGVLRAAGARRVRLWVVARTP